MGGAEPPASNNAPDLRTIALEAGLRPATGRQPLGEYLGELVRRRHFAVSLAHGRSSAQYVDTVLGRLWQVLAPILNVIVYYFIFGVLLNTSKGIENYIAFLVIGVFVFTFTQRSVTGGAKAIANNRSLIRAIQFPRAVLPLAVMLQELQQYLVSMVIACALVMISGEPPTWHWLAILPISVLQASFNTGLCFMIARWAAASRDVTQLIPFVMTVWRYISGVFYSIYVFTEGMEQWVRTLLYANPATVYIELMRDALMTSHQAPGFLWWYAAGWAVGSLVVGFLVFYRAEEAYGRG